MTFDPNRRGAWPIVPKRRIPIGEPRIAYVVAAVILAAIVWLLVWIRTLCHCDF